MKNKTMLTKMVSVASLGLLLGFTSINASAVLVLTPSDADATANIGDTIGGTTLPQCDTACIEALFPIIDANTAEMLYKDNVGGLEEKAFADSYTTTFSNTTSDPQDALITWDGPSIINSEVQILEVKDGNQVPAYYFFDISGWNGTEPIQLDGFWPLNGAISYVSIWGGDGEGGGELLPEPATLLLFGVGLFGLVMIRRRRT